MLHLSYFESIILNNKSKAVSCYANQYFYVTEYLSRKCLSKTRYMKDVICYLVELHQRTLKYENIESSYYNKLLLTFEESIKEYEKHDCALFCQLLNSEFPSPTLWTYTLNETCGKLYFEHFSRILKLYKIECLNITSRRVVLNFRHFDDNCFDSINCKLIGCQKMVYDSPVFDLVEFIDNSYSDDVLTCLKVYTDSFCLEKEEVILLICILYSRVKIVLTDDEYCNVYMINEICRKIEFIFALEELFGVDFSKLNC